MHDIHNHMVEEDLEQYSSGISKEEDVARYEEHLLVCEPCRSKVTETEGYLAAMQFATRQVRRESRLVKSPRMWRFPAWLPAFAAATCLFLVLVLAGLRFHGPQPALAVGLTALRGNASGVTAPAGRDLKLQPDLTGIATSSSYRLEIVDQVGNQVWQGTFAPGQAGVTVPGRSHGLYFVRIYLPQGELLREFGLDLK